jgi:uncharacterized protein (DUF1015 family)
VGDDAAALGDEENLSFTKDHGDALDRVRGGKVGLAVLTNPPTLEQLRLVCQAGERMPHKSTYFYPKIPSGLVMRGLDGGVSDP